MKTLIVKYVKSDFEKEVSKWFNLNNCDVLGFNEITKGKTGISKRLSYIHRAIQIKNDNYDLVIIFDDYDFYIACRLLGIKNAYLWLWNIVSKKSIDHIRLNICRFLGNVYSFDKGDCFKYRIRFNTQFYSFAQCNSIPISGKNQTLYFIGKDKGRYNLIFKIAKYLENKNISFSFNVVPDCIDCHYRNDLIIKNYISYNDVCCEILKSDAILDIVQNGQEGLTLRAMEAIFFNKRIVTNNLSYKNYDFFSPDRVFIIENDTLTGLDSFLNNENQIVYSNDIKHYYDITNWIKRFGDDRR